MTKVKLTEQEAEIRYASWVKMLIDLVKPQNLYLIGGRGVAKSTDILAERTIDVVFDMPRAPFAFVSDTYVNLLTNILPQIFTGWSRKKFIENFHYVVDKEPPNYWDKSLVPGIYHKHTISTFNGCKFFLKSLDRPSINAGISVAHQFGDEAKYLKKDKLNKLFPTLRGDAILLSHSPYFMGQTFCTDMPNPAVGEDAWILEMEKKMDKKMIVKILQTAWVVNELNIDLLKAKQHNKDQKKIINLSNNLSEWEKRLRKLRYGSTFFHVVSSFANADILTLDYFKNLLNTLGSEEFRTAVLSLRGSLDKTERFYFNLTQGHFYYDGYDYDYYDQFGLRDNISQTSKGLRYIQHDKPLEAGFDPGNMMSLLIGQDQGKTLRALKFLYTLVPQFIEDLALKFTDFFRDHKHKVLHLYYDRSAAQYGKAKQDFASKLKSAIETQNGKRTGWIVMLMSTGQKNIEHWQEYQLVNEMLSGNNTNLPSIAIDAFECKEIKSSLELAPMSKDRGRIQKVKKSEKLKVQRLPMESTNPSDAFKYWVCRKKFFALMKGKTTTVGDLKIYS
ncbi:MAG: hypothetical protein AB9842_08225 [Bacteroidales bacterium]